LNKKTISRKGRRQNASVFALTCAAAALPGMTLPIVQAQTVENSQRFQAAQYLEGDRDLISNQSGLKPISVEVTGAMGSYNLGNRWRLNYKIAQDVWSGATPVATAPLAFQGNRPILRNTTNGVVESGASPYVNGTMRLDAQLRPVAATPISGALDANSVLIMSSASPEIRRQADVSISYEWDEAMLSWTTGTSREEDYQSQFFGLNGKLDFNQKLTALSAGVSYSDSHISAVLDSDLQPYLTKLAYQDRIRREKNDDVFTHARRDWSASLGWSQVLSRHAIMELNAGIIDSSGFMANPYKATIAAFYDPVLAQASSGQGLVADVRALMEQRPERRRQTGAGGKYIHHIARFDSAVHASYQYSNDTWGVSSHTLELNWIQPLRAGWTATPTLRYYSQKKADFYVDFLLSGQRYREVSRDTTGREVWESVTNPAAGYSRNSDGSFLDAQGAVVDLSLISLRPRYRYFDFDQLPQYFSSDHRLAGFGSISAGLNVSKELSRNTTLELGVEYYRRADRLRAGGGTGSAFADHDALMTTATLSINPQRFAEQQRLNRLAGVAEGHDAHHAHTSAQHSHIAPAGVMFAHVMNQPGSLMVGYGFEQTRNSNQLFRGGDIVSDSDLLAKGCSNVNSCRLAPDQMVMNMHMLDVGYALTNNLSVMMMAHFMDMNMTLRDVAGRPPSQPGTHEHKNLRGHTTGGFGDTVAGAVYRFAGSNEIDIQSEWLAGIAVSIPTGSVNKRMRRMFREDGGLMHFDMQTGSGTWDLLPSLTYNASNHQGLSWGAQLAATYRMGHHNRSGYKLGHAVRMNAWGTYALNSWVSATARITSTSQQSISGDFNDYNSRLGPMDYPANSGGRFVDAGLGARLTIPSGNYVGHSVSLEWLEPVRQHVYGFQLPRRGSVKAAWQYMF